MLKISYILSALSLVGLFALIFLLVKNNFAHKKFKNILVIALTILLTFTIGYQSFYVTQLKLVKGDTKEEIVRKAQKELAQKFPDKVYNREAVKGDKEEFTKQGAVDALKDLLNQSLDKDGLVSAQDRFNNISNGGSYKDNIAKGVLDRYNIAKDMDSDTAAKNVTSILLSLSWQLSESGTKNIEVKSSDLTAVYLDEATNSAYIPMSIYTGVNNSVVVEMTYKEEHWYVSPYITLYGIQLTNSLKEDK